METKFTDLVRLKKQKLLECQKALMAKNHEIATQKDRLKLIKEQIIEIEFPENGTFKELLKIQEIKKTHQNELERTRLKIDELEAQKFELESLLKKFLMEYEKAKHLEDLEIDRLLKEAKKRELNRLNEISMMLYNNNNKRDER